MRVHFSCAAALVFAVALFGACNSNDGKTGSRGNTGNTNASAATNQQTPADGIPRITPAEAKAEVDRGEALIVDVRSPDAYNIDHIKGSINLVEVDLDARLKELPTDKKIIAYCSCPAEHSSLVFSQRLKTKGYNNVAALLGGTEAWRRAGYPMEKKQ